MRRFVLVLLVGCGDDDGVSNPGDDSGGDDDAGLVGLDECPSGRDKITFTRATGCQNDGWVEFCIPDNNPTLRAVVEGLVPDANCAAGGGRAGCSTPPARLLCFYPTPPSACEADDSAMTAATWDDMCTLAAQPEVTEIVPTFAE